MPSKKQADQARLAGARWSDNGYVTAWHNRQADLFQNGVAASAYGYVFERYADGGGSSGFGHWYDVGDLGGSAQRLHQSQRQVAIGRVLPGDERDVLAQHGEVQRPI